VRYAKTERNARPASCIYNVFIFSLTPIGVLTGINRATVNWRARDGGARSERHAAFCRLARGRVVTLRFQRTETTPT
jgi:hypothetical protein